MQNNAFYHKITLNLRGQLFTFDTPKVMGILNVTPDSFYADSRIATTTALLDRASQMAKDGVHFFDIGGYSTRPGASRIDEQEERARVIPAVTALAKQFPKIPISVDTFRASVARQAVEAGASLINDVTGGEGDPAMFKTVAALKVPYVLMHMRGTPETMASMNQYDNLLKEITVYFQEKLQRLHALGITDVILDPGFGFAKNGDQNFELLQHLSWVHAIFGLPILVGLSRKSMIWRTLNVTADQALNGTTGLHMLALQEGASLLRVHDVKEAVECIALYQRTKLSIAQ